MWKQTTERLFGQTKESLRRIELALQKPREAELREIESELLRCVAVLQELHASFLTNPPPNPTASGGEAWTDSLQAELLQFRALVRRIQALVDHAAAFHDRWNELARAEQGYGPSGELPPISAPAHHVLIRG
jgi:hypothetical protein